jgi:hypothetical protein
MTYLLADKMWTHRIDGVNNPGNDSLDVVELPGAIVRPPIAADCYGGGS